MPSHAWSALVTVAALTLSLFFGVRAALARRKYGLAAPAMSGEPNVERALRVQGNTVEWLPAFLGGLWLCSIYLNDRLAAALGLVWILGRVLYARGYWAEAGKRGPGFGIQALATFALLICGAVGAVRALLATGGV